MKLVRSAFSWSTHVSYACLMCIRNLRMHNVYPCIVHDSRRIYLKSCYEIYRQIGRINCPRKRTSFVAFIARRNPASASDIPISRWKKKNLIVRTERICRTFVRQKQSTWMSIRLGGDKMFRFARDKFSNTNTEVIIFFFFFYFCREKLMHRVYIYIYTHKHCAWNWT